MTMILFCFIPNAKQNEVFLFPDVYKTCMEVPLEIKKECFRLILIRLAQVKGEERESKIAQVLSFLPEILPSHLLVQNRRVIMALFDEYYQLLVKQKYVYLSDLIRLLRIAKHLNSPHEAKVVQKIRIYLASHVFEESDALPSRNEEMAPLFAYGFVRDMIAFTERFPVGSRRRREMLQALLGPASYTKHPVIKQAMQEVMTYLQGLPESERSALRLNIVEAAWNMGEEALARRISEEIALSAIKVKDAKMLCDVGFFALRDPRLSDYFFSPSQKILGSVNSLWRERVQDALTWESGKLLLHEPMRAFLSCGAWEETLKLVQENNAKGNDPIDYIGGRYGTKHLLLMLAIAFWKEGQQLEARQLYDTACAMPVKGWDSEREMLALMAAFCDTPEAFFQFAYEPSGYLASLLVEPLLKRGFMPKVLASVAQRKESSDRLRSYEELVTLVPDDHSLESAIRGEISRVKTLADKVELALLLIKIGQIAEATRLAWQMNEELQKHLQRYSRHPLEPSDYRLYESYPKVARVFFALGNTKMATHLLRQLGRSNLAFDDIIGEQLRCGAWQDALETAKKETNPITSIDTLLGIAQGTPLMRWGCSGGPRMMFGVPL
jgi:hypothetical protein